MISNSTSQNTLNTYYFIILMLLFFGIDQFTKYLVTSSIPLENILFSFWGFGITYKINKGFALHLLEQYEVTIIISIIIHILIIPIIILAYRFYKSNFRSNNLIKMSFILFMSGNLGNLCDQIFLGYVRDFILWPGPGTPNLADIFIDISIICIFIELIKNPQIDNKSLFKLKTTKDNYILFKKFITFSKHEVKSSFKKIQIC